MHIHNSPARRKTSHIIVTSVEGRRKFDCQLSSPSRDMRNNWRWHFSPLYTMLRFLCFLSSTNHLTPLAAHAREKYFHFTKWKSTKTRRKISCWHQHRKWRRNCEICCLLRSKKLKIVWRGWFENFFIATHASMTDIEMSAYIGRWIKAESIFFHWLINFLPCSHDKIASRRPFFNIFALIDAATASMLMCGVIEM
jgi:hypothetical protein